MSPSYVDGKRSLLLDPSVLGWRVGPLCVRRWDPGPRTDCCRERCNQWIRTTHRNWDPNKHTRRAQAGFEARFWSFCAGYPRGERSEFGRSVLRQCFGSASGGFGGIWEGDGAVLFVFFNRELVLRKVQKYSILIPAIRTLVRLSLVHLWRDSLPAALVCLCAGTRRTNQNAHLWR